MLFSTLPSNNNFSSSFTTIPHSFCHLTGAYYCAECLHPTALSFASAATCTRSAGITVGQHPIPARIVHNWDFQPRPVSRVAAAFLTEFNRHPFIDMRLLNPGIYAAVAPMAALQSLRIQLNFLRAYLCNCRTPTTEQVSLSQKYSGREGLANIQLNTITANTRFSAGTVELLYMNFVCTVSCELHVNN